MVFHNKPTLGNRGNDCPKPCDDSGPDDDGCSIVNAPDSQRTYSTVWANERSGVGHARGMLDSPQGWSVGKTDDNPWMQIDLGEDRLVGGVVTQGRGDGHDQ